MATRDFTEPYRTGVWSDGTDYRGAQTLSRPSGLNRFQREEAQQRRRRERRGSRRYRDDIYDNGYSLAPASASRETSSPPAEVAFRANRLADQLRDPAQKAEDDLLSRANPQERAAYYRKRETDRAARARGEQSLLAEEEKSSIGLPASVLAPAPPSSRPSGSASYTLPDGTVRNIDFAQQDTEAASPSKSIAGQSVQARATGPDGRVFITLADGTKKDFANDADADEWLRTGKNTTGTPEGNAAAKSLLMAKVKPRDLFS